jgi:mRNA-degrading endonuclease RelE of RelBE toxin-antitoxin system
VAVVAVKVDGLAQFQRDLKKLDSDLPKALRVALNKAADVIVTDARPEVPKRTGRAQGSVRARSTRTAVRVSAGGRRAPYYPWLDFGGKVGRHRSVSRAFFTDGRYLYPTYFRRRDAGEFQEVLAAALLDVASAAGIEVQ